MNEDTLVTTDSANILLHYITMQMALLKRSNFMSKCELKKLVKSKDMYM